MPGFESFGTVNIDALSAGPFTPDGSKTNVTSIGFLFEFDGKRIVFTGDADDGRLVASLQPLAAAEGGRLRIDALKVAHHGSDHNLSTDLLDLLDCKRYLISTSGARHSHPNETAIARILKHGGPGKELVFNYRDRATRWDVEALKSNWLRVRGPSSFVNPSQIWVYLDESRFGGVDRLRELPTTSVAFVHWFSGIEASARWGPGHDDGVILVATRLEYPDRIFVRERLFCQFTHPKAGEWIACPFLND